MRRLCAALAMALLASAAAADCDDRNVSDVAFASYDIFATFDTDSTGSIRVGCAPAAPYTIKLSTGGNGGYVPRRLSSAGGTLDYNLYLDAGRTQIWGDGSAGTTFLSVAAHSGARTYTIYGRIPKGQDPSVGAYSDMVVTTIDF